MRADRRPRAALPLALGACALLLLALAAFSLGTPAAADGHALLSPRGNITPASTATPTPTATATPSAGTISLVSPSYGSGPAGAHVTVSGTGFSGTSVTLKAASHADCTSSQATLARAALSSGAFSNNTFIWPSSLPNGTYYICAAGTTSGPAYQQLATSAPAISLSAPSVAQEGQLVISGSNFVGLSAGSSIQLTAQQGTAQTTLQPAVIDANGQFTQPWTVDFSLTGTVVIAAQSAPEGSAPPVLQATASVTILPPATATASATVSPTATAGAGGIGGTTTGNNGSNGGGAGLVLLLVLLLVALLVGGGAAAFVLLRRGGTGGNQGSYSPSAGTYPRYSPYGSPPQAGWDATAGRLSGVGPTGQYGQYGAPGMGTGMGTGAYGAPGGYSGSGAGAVSQWDEPTEEFGDEPSPSWQPRPMTGYGNYQGDYDLPSGPPPGANPYAPADPWGDRGGGYGNYGSQGGNGGGYGTAERGDWRNRAPGAPGAPGATRPDGGGTAGQYSRYPGAGQGQGEGQSQGYGQSPGAGWPPDDAPPDDWRQ